MFKELIEKIQELTNEPEHNKHKYSGEYRGGWDDCIDKVKEILEDTIPQPQDKPDKTGWWLAVPIAKSNEGIIKEENLAFFFIRNYLGVGLLIPRINAKWYKVTTPTTKDRGIPCQKVK